MMHEHEHTPHGHGRHFRCHRESCPLWLEIKKLPAFRFLLAPTQTISELYERYPDGAERGAVSFCVFRDGFYYFDFDRKEWRLTASSPAMGEYERFMTDHAEVNDLTNLPTFGQVYAEISADDTLSLTELPRMRPGYEMNIRIRNTGTEAVTVTLPPDAEPYENDLGESITIGAGEVTEISVRSFKPDWYRIRGTASLPPSNPVLEPTTVVFLANGEVDE